MELNSIVLVFMFGAVFSVVSSNRERKINEILEIVRRIEDHVSKEDRLREIADMVRIDANVDKLNAKVERILSYLEMSPQPSAVGRSATAVISSDLGSGLEMVQDRLQKLETSVLSVEENIKKMDFDPVKMNEIERRTTQLKDDMNTKLRKMMNIMSALYELNKEMKANVDAQNGNPDQTNGEEPSTTSFSSEFFVENLEELERKIKEQFSVLTSQMQYEVSNLKTVALSAGSSCESTPKSEVQLDDEDDEWTPMARSGRNQNQQSGRSLSNQPDDALNNIIETLGRSTREIRENIEQSMQNIDTKLDNLTNIAQKSQSACSDPLEVSESIRSSRKITMPYTTAQSLNSKVKSESCTRTVRNVPNAKSCAELKKGGATCDGIYVIFPKGRRAVRVLCDMNSDGGGWTVLMRRGSYGDKMTSFHRNWLSYKNGFGDSEGEFWIGNDVIHFMTAEEDNMLRIHMDSFDEDYIDLDYSSFAVGNESTNYRLILGPPKGPPKAAANSLRYHNNHPFSTFDRKNDDFEQNCAATYKGGWWFNGCYFGFLTGEYFSLGEKRENWQGMLWYDWKGTAALKGALMMIRPKDFVA